MNVNKYKAIKAELFKQRRASLSIIIFATLQAYLFRI